MMSSGASLRLPRREGVWHVGKILGEGGQGTVFELTTPGNPPLALKWYRQEAGSAEQRAALLALVERPAPSPNFLWPLDVIDGPDGEFGYVMPLRPVGFLPLADLLTGRADVKLAIMARLAMSLADSFLQLHAQGLCYRDISLGNVFFDPASGTPLICDNDNVGIDGSSEARVLGTARFMAPEIIRGEAQPSTATDLYSLAVLVFYVLTFHHPLVGRKELAFACLDAAADDDLFGKHPRFVFDPDDSSNAPDPVHHPGVLTMWRVYPPFVQAEFVRAFTAGLLNPSARVREGVWRARLARLLNSVVRCCCGRDNFSNDGRTETCWGCGRAIVAALMLRTPGSLLALNADTRLMAHHIRHNYDYDTVVGRVVAHPSRPGVWGLTNLSDLVWSVQIDGRESVVEPGRSVGLVTGLHLDFGHSRAGGTGELIRP